MASNTCFGIYEFTDEKKGFFKKVIKPLVESHTGLVYQDAQDEYEPKEIKMYRIAEMIRKSRLVIVDVDNQNANVFFELGVAYESKIPTVIICKEKAFLETWNSKPPFDLQGREFLIYKDNQDLKVQLSKKIHSTIYLAKKIIPTWLTKDTIVVVKAPDSLEMKASSQAWVTQPLNCDFVISYDASLSKGHSKNPDLRFHISNKPYDLKINEPSNFPRITVIYPWEIAEDEDKFQCHIDYFEKPEDHQKPGARLVQQSVSINNKSSQMKFSAFCTFCFPSMVFEASNFSDATQRLIVSKDFLAQRGFLMNRPVYIGFETVANTMAEISNISISEIESN